MIPARPDLRIAIVGAGAAGLYAVGELLKCSNPAVEIDIFERLPTPWGLVRAAVAPDHPQKKLIIDRLFDFFLKDARVRFFGNVDVGTTVKLSDLQRWYHAAIFTVGASADVKLGIAGESLPGVHAARDFVGFYNGHPDFSQLAFKLDCPRAVIVGNGNVALDVARILTLPIADLARTDMPEQALATLRKSKVEEVVILGRRGPEHAAYHAAELEEFLDLDTVDVCIQNSPGKHDNALAFGWGTSRKLDILRRLADRPRRVAARKIVFKFHAPPLAFIGTDRVEAIELGDSKETASDANRAVLRKNDRLDARLVFRACGYRGTPTDGLPFDHAAGVIANCDGRVRGDKGALTGVYVAGWIKRGCRGIIGSNKQCARETVAGLLEDFKQGMLLRHVPDRDAVLHHIARAAPARISLDGWLRIDRAERTAGRLAGRARIKIANRTALLAAAATPVVANCNQVLSS